MDVDRMVYRPALVRVVSAVYVIFALWWVGSLVLTGRGAQALAIGPWLVAVGAALWAVFFRPAVVVDREAVRLLNVLRDVRVSWSALEGVETRFALTLIAAGRRYTSWAAAAPGRRARLGGPLGHPGLHGAPEGDDPHQLPHPRWAGGHAGSALRSSRDLRGDSGAAALMVESAWSRWRDTPGSGVAPATGVDVRWNLATLVSVALPALVGVLVGLAR